VDVQGGGKVAKFVSPSWILVTRLLSDVEPADLRNIQGVTKTEKNSQWQDRKCHIIENATSSYAHNMHKIALPPPWKVGRHVAQGCTRTEMFTSLYEGEVAYKFF